MAITQAMCNSFKQELLVGTHNFAASSGDSFKLSDASFTSATITARGALIYNDSQSDKAVCVLDFGADKTSTSGTFTIQFPTADASNAIIRIA